MSRISDNPATDTTPLTSRSRSPPSNNTTLVSSNNGSQPAAWEHEPSEAPHCCLEHCDRYCEQLCAPQKSCFCCCQQSLMFLPLIFVTLLSLFTYYVYVVELCIFTVENPALIVLFLLIFHIGLIMFLWSFYAAAFMPRKLIPAKYRIPDQLWQRWREQTTWNETDPVVQDALKQLVTERRLRIITRNRFDNKSYKICKTCKILKPDRAHHCGTCEICVMRLDHHCVWVNNCVGFHNHKFFFLWLFYGAIGPLYVVATILPYLIINLNTTASNFGNILGNSTDITNQPLPFYPLPWRPIAFLIVICLMAATSLSCFAMFFTILPGILKNCTGVEDVQYPRGVQFPWDLGNKLKNVKELFGDNIALWFFPFVTSKGNGYEYPTGPNFESVEASTSALPGPSSSATTNVSFTTPQRN